MEEKTLSQKLDEIYAKATKKLIQNEPIEALALYNEAENIILTNLKDASNTTKYAKWAGWGIALFMGGPGIEDIIIGPLIAKAIMAIFGINLNEINQLMLKLLSKKLRIISKYGLTQLADQEEIIKNIFIISKLKFDTQEGMLSKIITKDILPFVDNTNVEMSEKNESMNNLLVELNTLYNENSAKIIDTDEDFPVIADLAYKYDLEGNSFYEVLSSILSSSRRESYNNGNQDRNTAMRILGLTEGFTKEDLKNAYRTKIKENHPDKVASLSEALRKVAEEQTMKINEAYNFLND